MDPIDESMEIQSSNHQQQPLLHINQAFVNYRKNISNDDKQISQYNVDSAYGSGYNLVTPNNTPNASSTNTNNNEALTPQRNNKYNNNNSNITHEHFNHDSINLTPVTQNINRICSFHITTPKSQDFLNTHNNNKKDSQQIFNIKRSSDYLYDFDNFQSTPKKFKIHKDNSNNELLLLKYDKNRNSTPLKQKDNNKNLKFRQKLHSAPDLDGYFDENLFSPKKLNKTSNRIPFINLLTNNNTIYEQKSTSTPITTIIQNTDSVKKLLNCSNEEFNILINTKGKYDNDLKNIDESLEFNDYYTDTNLNDLKNNNLIKKINTHEPIKIETNAAKTPFRRFLSFANNDDNEFKSPKCSTINNSVNSINSVESNSSTTTVTDDEFYLENSFRQYNKQYRILNTVCSDRLRAKQRANAARLADLENTFYKDSISKKSQSTDNDKDFNGSINPSNIQQKIDINLNHNNLSSLVLANSNNNKNNDGISIICNKEKTDDEFIPLTPPKRKLSFADEFVAFTDKDHKNYTIESDTRNILPRTPKKLKIFQSNVAQNSNYEKYDIIYPTIPTTPRKNVIQLSPKRKQQERKNSKPQYRKFYGGAIHLNIIAKLESYTIVLDHIFDYLNNYDLLNLSMVTKTHRKIVQNNSKANRRLHKHLNYIQQCKENYITKNYDIVKENKKSNSEIICSQSKKMPFSQFNYKLDRKRSLDIVHSPPVSPSKKKFYEHQKVVKMLSGNQIISTCPNCGKKSLVNTSLGETKHNNNNNNFTNTTSYNTNSTESFHEQSSSTAYFVPKKDDDEIKGFIGCDRYKNDDTSKLFKLSQPIKPILIHPKSKLIKSASVDTGLLQINTKRQQKQRFQAFGDCMSIKSNSEFCLNCEYEYHLDNKSISPTKEEIENGMLQLINSPHSKKAIAAARGSKKRKSLKRLCF